MTHLFRCHSLGRLMTSTTAAAAKAGEVLSVGAKTFIRELAAQDIMGIDFVVSSKEMEKGIVCEGESIALLNRVRGLALSKNTERRSNGMLSGECDLFDAERREGFDVKTSWSVKTFPAFEMDAVDSMYEWQARAYMWLWDASRWTVAYCLLDTPPELIGYEPASLHVVSHVPEHMRITTWTIERDAEKEALIAVKVAAAREYYADVIAEFERTHKA